IIPALSSPTPAESIRTMRLSALTRDGTARGFYMSHDNYVSIDHPGATFTNALGINPRGETVGRYIDASGRHGYVLSRGTFSTIDVPGATLTGVTAINPEGDIVGRFSSAGVFHGFVLSRDESHG